MTTKISPIQRFIKLLNLDRETVININIYAILNGIITLSLPLGIQAIINFITGGQFATTWYVLVIIVIFGILISGILQILQLSLAEDLQQKIFANSALEFTYRIPRLKREEIERFNLPEMVNRFFDTLTLQKGISKLLLDFTRSSLQVVFGILLLSLYHPFFIAYGLALFVILLIALRFTGPLGLQSSIKESSYKYQLVHWLEELARTFEGFKMAGNVAFPLERSNGIVKDYLKYRKKHFRVLALQYLIMVFFKVFITGGLLILGGILVINNQMNIGQFVAAEVIIILLMTSIEKLMFSFETIYDVLTALEKIGYFTDLTLEKQGGLRIKPDDKGIKINFIDLTFHNITDEIKVDKLNAAITSGEKIAVTGFDKSGTSLFLHMAAGSYRDFEGVVSYNNIPIGNIDIMDLRQYIGENLGRDLIFEGTVTENITLGRKQITQDEIEEMSSIIGLSADIENLRDGYDEVLRSGGKYLPETVPLKLLLVRALIHKPKLIVLKDNFDMLDNETIDGLFEYLLSAKTEATVIIATRKRKYLKLIDNIIWMQDGKVRKKGAYKELLLEDDFTFMVK